MTKVFYTDPYNIDMDVIRKCADIIKAGGIVAFPTETVYGLGASAFDSAACEKIYTAKGRPEKKALSCLVSSIDDASQIAELNDTAIKLLHSFSPGPLTLVLPKKKCVSDIVTAGGITVAIRIPDNKIALELINSCGVPLAAPSANISGMPSPKNAKDVLSQLDGKIDALIDGGVCSIGTESTIVMIKNSKGTILRQGALSRSKIAEYVELTDNG